MKLGRRPRKWLDKKSKLGFRGYPVGTVAFYGRDAQQASKLVVAVIVAPDNRTGRVAEVVRRDRRYPQRCGNIRGSRLVSSRP